MVPLFRKRPEELDFSSHDEVIDVRSPGEFAEDHLPGAINLPVLDDAEREEVGRIYHQDSPFLARRRGAALITGRIRHMLDSHFEHKAKTYRPLLYCWRGGQRSQSLATILQAVGWPVTLLDGGYKAWRRHLLGELEARCAELKVVVLGGLTGSGKTRFLRTLERAGDQVLDLEALANHRGSVLGDEPGGQPAQKLFESRIFQELSRLDLEKPVLVEAESARIGVRQIPGCLWTSMQRGRYLELDVPLPLRAALLIEDYPHFRDDPETLLARLRPLAQHRGEGRIARWESLITENQWDELVGSLLRDHYDLGYLKALRKHYGTPATILPIDSISPTAHQHAAERIRAMTASQSSLATPSNSTRRWRSSSP